MKKLYQCVFMLFVLTACGKSNQDELIEELIPLLWEAQEDKTEQAETIYTHFFALKIDRALDEDVFAKVANVHAMATRFYNFTDAAKVRYNEGERVPHDELVVRFAQSFDSISAILPGEKFTRFDYLKSQGNAHALLTIGRMRYEMAALETDIMNHLAAKEEASAIRDDFNRFPYTDHLKASEGFQYSFTVRMKYLQKADTREIRVDSLLSNGKLTRIPNYVDQDDILGVVNFKTLPKGNYVAKGKVNAVVDNRAFSLPFSHHFSIP